MSHDAREAVLNLTTHHNAWRGAILGMVARAAAVQPTGEPDDDGDLSYWQHELRAFDRTFAVLATLSPMGLLEEVREALDWAIAEIEGRTRYTPNNLYESEEQRDNALGEAKTALAKLHELTALECADAALTATTSRGGK